MTDKPNSNKRRTECSMGNEQKRHDSGLTKESACFLLPASPPARLENPFPYNYKKGEFYNQMTATMHDLTQIATVDMLQLLQVEEDHPVDGIQQLRNEVIVLETKLKDLNAKLEEKQKTRDNIIAHTQKAVEHQQHKFTKKLAEAARAPKEQLENIASVNRAKLLQDIQQKLDTNTAFRVIQSNPSEATKLETLENSATNATPEMSDYEDEMEISECDQTNQSKELRKEKIAESNDEAEGCEEEEDREDSTEDSVNNSM